MIITITRVLRKFEANASVHKIPQHYLFLALQNCRTAPSRIWQVALTNPKEKRATRGRLLPVIGGNMLLIYEAPGSRAPLQKAA